MSRAWMTAQALADLRLPGLPTSKVGVIDRAKREAWKAQPRMGRGGGIEYHTASLPAEARAELLTRAADAVPAVPAERPNLPAVPAPAVALMADWQRRTMDARAAILAELERLAAVGGISAAIAELVSRAKAGTLQPALQQLLADANARGGKTGTRTVSAMTLYRWRREGAERGVSALAPIAPPPPAERPAWAAPLLKARRGPQKQKLTEVMRALPQMLPPGVPMPSYDAARRFIGALSIVERERGRRGPNDLLAVQGFKRRSTAHQSPMDARASAAVIQALKAMQSRPTPVRRATA